MESPCHKNIFLKISLVSLTKVMRIFHYQGLDSPGF